MTPFAGLEGVILVAAAAEALGADAGGTVAAERHSRSQLVDVAHEPALLRTLIM